MFFTRISRHHLITSSNFIFWPLAPAKGRNRQKPSWQDYPNKIFVLWKREQTWWWDWIHLFDVYFRNVCKNSQENWFWNLMWLRTPKTQHWEDWKTKTNRNFDGRPVRFPETDISSRPTYASNWNVWPILMFLGKARRGRKPITVTQLHTSALLIPGPCCKQHIK